MSPEDIVKVAESQGFRVKEVRHGWFIFPPDGVTRPAWIGRNTGKRSVRNMIAEARKAGVQI